MLRLGLVADPEVIASPEFEDALRMGVLPMAAGGILVTASQSGLFPNSSWGAGWSKMVWLSMDYRSHAYRVPAFY